MPSAGTTTARGYGYAHQATRAEWAPKVATGTVPCWRCGLTITPGTPWDLGHDQQRRTRGPEHRHRQPSGCPGNRSEGATRGNRARGRRRRPRTPRSRILLVIDDW